MTTVYSVCKTLLARLRSVIQSQTNHNKSKFQSRSFRLPQQANSLVGDGVIIGVARSNYHSEKALAAI